MSRQILLLPGSESVPGYPKLDVSQAEIDVANIASLVYWPGLFDWDVSGGAILDRMTDATCPTAGVSVPANNFEAMLNGKKGYKVSTASQVLRPGPFSAAGSFTIAAVCSNQIAFGSNLVGAKTDVPAPWGIYTNNGGSGLVTANFGTLVISEAGSGAWTKQLSSTALTAFVMIFDRVNGKVSFRYNGEEVGSLTHANLKTMVLMNDLALGGLQVGDVATPAFRPIVTNAFLAFNSALSGNDLISLETMLLETAKAA